MPDLPDLTEDQWQELLERLTWHAQQKYLRLVWQGVPAAIGGVAPGGVEPGDVAAQAIIDVIEGRRTWKRAAKPEFLDFLKGVVDSKLSHLARGRDNRFVRAAPPAEFFPSRDPPPEDVAAEGEELERLQGIILSAIEDDPLAHQVLECLEAGITKPARMAARIGVDVGEIYNAQRRLRHKVGSALYPDRGGEP